MSRVAGPPVVERVSEAGPLGLAGRDLALQRFGRSLRRSGHHAAAANPGRRWTLAAITWHGYADADMDALLGRFGIAAAITPAPGG